MPATRDSEIVVDRSLGRLFHLLERLRFLGALLLTTLFVILLSADEPIWKPALAASALVILLTLSWLALKRPHATFASSDLIKLFGSILGAQLVAVALTGGIRSPILLIMPPLLLFLALGISRRRPLGASIAALLALIWLLALGDLLGAWRPEALVPEVLVRHDDGGAGGYVLAIAAAFTIIAIAAAVIGVYTRRTLREAIDTAIQARAETLDAMRARHHALEALSGAVRLVRGRRL
jgi:hypothetical protein